MTIKDFIFKLTLAKYHIYEAFFASYFLTVTFFHMLFIKESVHNENLEVLLFIFFQFSFISIFVLFYQIIFKKINNLEFGQFSALLTISIINILYISESSFWIIHNT